MQLQHTWTPHGLWLRWALANFGGLIAGMATFLAVGAGFAAAGVGPGDTPPPVFGAILGTIFGAALGTAQWLVIRPWIPRSASWAPATTLGMAVAFTAIFGLLGEESGVMGKVLDGLLHGAVIGLLLGSLQWLILRRHLVRAWWWVPASAVSWAIAAGAGDAVGFVVGGPVDLAVGFILAGVLTGAAVARLCGPTSSAGEGLLVDNRTGA